MDIDAPTVADEYPGVGATDPVTNAPGLALVFGPTTEQDSGWQFVLSDANGNKLASGYAEFDPDPNPDDDGRSVITNRPHGWHAVRIVAFDPGWGVLPVRPESDQESRDPEPEPIPLGQSVSYRHARDGSVLDTTYTVSHAHPHDHAYGGGADGYTESHSHAHTHSDHDSFRSTVYGHALDPHAHDH